MKLLNIESKIEKIEEKVEAPVDRPALGQNSFTGFEKSMSARQPTPDSHRAQSKPQPPQWAQRFIEWYCKPTLAEDLIGDLNEYFERNVESKGPLRAKLIYIIDAFKFFRLYTVRAPKFISLLINWIMIGSYVKTSVRTLTRNKLFSTINIVGLSISMSVGLLLIAFVLDLGSYDRFNKMVRESIESLA